MERRAGVGEPGNGDAQLATLTRRVGEELRREHGLYFATVSDLFCRTEVNGPLLRGGRAGACIAEALAGASSRGEGAAPLVRALQRLGRLVDDAEHARPSYVATVITNALLGIELAAGAPDPQGFREERVRALVTILDVLLHQERDADARLVLAPETVARLRAQLLAVTPEADPQRAEAAALLDELGGRGVPEPAPDCRAPGGDTFDPSQDMFEFCVTEAESALRTFERHFAVGAWRGEHHVTCTREQLWARGQEVMRAMFGADAAPDVGELQVVDLGPVSAALSPYGVYLANFAGEAPIAVLQPDTHTVTQWEQSVRAFAFCHEVVPGHHLQWRHVAHAAVFPLEQDIFASVATQEGWAMLVEDVFAGLGDVEAATVAYFRARRCVPVALSWLARNAAQHELRPQGLLEHFAQIGPAFFDLPENRQLNEVRMEYVVGYFHASRVLAELRASGRTTAEGYTVLLDQGLVDLGES